MKAYLIPLVVILLSCEPGSQSENHTESDPLPSWNNGPVRASILDFVQRVTNHGGPDFVPENDRIAVFDNDGNLWSEKPLYFQLLFGLDRLKRMAPEHHEWDTVRAFRLALYHEADSLGKLNNEDLLRIMIGIHGATSAADFKEEVVQWIDSAKHPRFDRHFTELVFQPMLEVINHLKANGFTVFIVSGGGSAFMRPWTEDVYGIPDHQVVGTELKAKFEIIDGEPTLLQLPRVSFLNDKEGKPIGIYDHIGKRPIFCSGNSDGDLAMMEWTAAGPDPNMILLLHHTDSIREWAYDRKSSVGRLNKALDRAYEENWKVVDMAKDWKVIYPFDAN